MNCKGIRMIFGKNINHLTEKNDIKKFPEFKKYLNSHTVQRTYYFHIFKFSNADCKFYKLLRGEAPPSLGDPIQCTNEDGITYYNPGSDLGENYMLSKLRRWVRKPRNGIWAVCSKCFKCRTNY